MGRTLLDELRETSFFLVVVVVVVVVVVAFVPQIREFV